MDKQGMFPKDKKRLAEAIDSAYETGRIARNPHRIDWKIAYYYLQGARSFVIDSWKEGTVRAGYKSRSGQYELRVEDTLVQVQRELGTLMRIDVRPLVKRKGTGLDSLRKSSCGQVILDNIASGIDLEDVKMKTFEADLIFGNVGIHGHVIKNMGMDPEYCIELVPPWEVVPIPASPTLRSQVYGCIRGRMVPYEWVKERFPDAKLPSMTDENHAKLEVRFVQPGEKVEDGVKDDPAPPATSMQMGVDDVGPGEPFVPVREVWLWDHADRVNRYILKVGKVIIFDKVYGEDGEMKPPMPIAFPGYLHTGAWWRRSFVSTQIPVNIVVEQMYSNLFENVKNLRLYGFTLVPNTWQLKKEAFAQASVPGIIGYEPDWNAPNVREMSIAPANTGDFPGRVAQSGMALLDRLGRSSEIFQGGVPGRLQSGVGLGIIYEALSIPVIPVAESISKAFSQVWKYFLYMAKGYYGPGSSIAFTSVDDCIAGVVIDRETGKIKLDDTNPIPSPEDVEITIREKVPQMQNQIKQEMLQSMQLGLLPPDELLFKNYSDNRGMQVGMDEVVHEWRKAMYRNILQFNDGKTPGQVQVDVDDNHVIQIKVIKRFMARLEFELATPAVQEAFKRRLSFHQQGMANWPEGVPNPEEMQMSSDMLPGSQVQGGQIPPQLQRMLQSADQESAMQQMAAGMSQQQ